MADHAAASWILSEGLAGLQAQAFGLAEAAGLTPELRVLAPARAVEMDRGEAVAAAAGCGRRCRARARAAAGHRLRRHGGGGRRGAAARQPRHRAGAASRAWIPRRFDLIVVNRHDELTGPNVVVTRTALHRVTPERLAAAADAWRERFAHLPRPLVAVLVGGSNGRLPAGRHGRRAARRRAGRDDAARRGRRDGHPVAPHRPRRDARADRDAGAAGRLRVGWRPARTRISACWPWPMRSW